MEESKQVDLELESSPSWEAILKNKVKSLPLRETWLRGQKSNIQRVWSHFRIKEPEAYEPQLVSIGPFHHGKSHLLPMEEIKLENIHFLFGNEMWDETYHILTDEISSCLRLARELYSMDIDMSDDRFAEMLMLDSCFIIGLCFRFSPIRAISLTPTPGVPRDKILWRDMMLLENQIPFFVLNRIYKKIVAVSTCTDDYPDLASLLLNILGIYLPREKYPKEEKVLHILHLKHLSLDPDLIPHKPPSRFFKTPKLQCSLLTPSAKELDEAGIKFQKIKMPKEYDNGFHVKVYFSAGTLHISPLSVNYLTRHELRNLVAFEQCEIYFNSPKHFTKYCTFMGYLIKTPQDVGILRANGILKHLVDESEVVKVFNALTEVTIFNLKKPSCINLCKEVAFLRKAPWQRWHTNLGTIFSVVAVILILFLTDFRNFPTTASRSSSVIFPLDV